MAISGVTTYLWFDNNALEAAEFYASIFPNSRIKSTSHYLEDAQLPAGTVLVVEFDIFGQPFAALNGGPAHNTHSEAVSFQVLCDTQAEVDFVWNGLIADGGVESRCGWCKDRFGISWQVTPKVLGELLSGNDKEKSSVAFNAMMKMHKIKIEDLYE